MDRNSKSSDSDDRDTDFHFGFNDVNFSDRLLRVEIVADPADGRPEVESRRTQIGCSADNIVEKLDALDIGSNCAEEDAIDSNQPDVEATTILEKNHDEEELPATEDSSSEAANDDSNRSDGLRVLRVVTLHISSLVLAANSPFFYKLFSNGMIESEQRHATLRISASEEAALMELLKFMYSGKLNVGAASALLEVLIAADKFEVASCTKHCSRLLREIPMSLEFALLCLDLPSSIFMADAVRPLIDAVKQFLVAKYKDIAKYQSEVMNLPLSAIEAILSSDDLVVATEDVVYDFMLKWARTHYQNLDEQRNILSHLARHIRLAYLSHDKLKDLWTSNDFDHNFGSETFFNAIFSKGRERAYKLRGVKVVNFEHPRQESLIYLKLKREECVNLFPSGKLHSQAFLFCGQQFYLTAKCLPDDHLQSEHSFGLFLTMKGGSSKRYCVCYEYAVRSNPTQDYIVCCKGNNCIFSGGSRHGASSLFQWKHLMSNYFIKNVLYLRVELAIKHV